MYKLVPEHINEVINFERKQNKMSSLGIGNRKIIENWLHKMQVTNYVINDDLTIDVKYSVDLENKNLIEFPEYIQFNEVNGWFSCSRNRLISLRGCPKIVNSWFDCNHNYLTSLEGCPKIVQGNFWCVNNAKFFSKKYVRSLCIVNTDVINI